MSARMYRVELSLKVDLYAESEEAAIREARYYLIDDKVPADIVEAMDGRAIHAGPDTDFDPVNEPDDKEDISS